MRWDTWQEASWSQEGEDRILFRFFEQRTEGFYVDVGAHHPKRFSNTYLFYRRGWRGVNIDAMPGSMDAFRRMRPRDINLECGVGPKEDTLTYHIRAAQPPRLYIAADGPRADRAGETERVAQTRAIATAVDWHCEVKTLFRDENLGCKMAVSGAITWFFNHEERGIILEDDCLPAPSFFPFCETLLERYKDDKRIWHIGGTNPLPSAKAVSDGYYYSVYNRIWGWATWRRAWSAYDVAISDWPEAKRTGMLHDLLPTAAAEYYTQIFSRVHEGKIDTWDYQWLFTRLTRGLAVIPDVNLISNIGFGEGATHTIDTRNPLSRIPTGRITFPLRAPSSIRPDAQRDAEWARMAFKRRTLGSRVRALGGRILKGIR